MLYGINKFTSCTDTVERELQSSKQENESKTTQLNTTMEDLNSTKVRNMLHNCM